MRRLDSLLTVLAIVLLSTSLAGSASAGYWRVIYDLAPGSFLKTFDILGASDIDPMTGKFTFQYDAASQGAPLTGARFTAGKTNVQMYQPNFFFLLTGSVDLTYKPGPGGTTAVLGPATGLTAAEMQVGVVATSEQKGFLHCSEGAGQIGNCALAQMDPVSATFPQEEQRDPPFTQTFPKFIFTSGTAGVGDFTSTLKTQTVQTLGFTVTLYSTFVGREVSRVWWTGAPGVPSISNLGLAGLGLWIAAVGLGGTLWLQRRRRAAKTG